MSLVWHCAYSMQPIGHSVRQCVYKQWARCLSFQVRKKLLLSSVLLDFRKSIAVWKVPRFRTSLLGRATCRWRWVLTIGGIILAGEMLSTRGKTCSSVTLSHYKSHMDWPGNNLGLPRSEAGRNYGAAFKRLTCLLIKIQSVQRGKQSIFLLYKPVSYCCIGK